MYSPKENTSGQSRRSAKARDVIHSLTSGSGQRCDQARRRPLQIPCRRFCQQIVEPLAPLCEVDRPAIVGVDQIEIPQFGALIEIRHAGKRHFQQQLGQRVDKAAVGDAAHKRRQVGLELRARSLARSLDETQSRPLRKASDGFIHEVWILASRKAFCMYCTMRSEYVSC